MPKHAKSPALHIRQPGSYMMVMADVQNKTEKTISDAAARALAEAEARRKSASPAQLPKEIDGRKGPEPTRFGDWEVKGITSDF
jgi:hypothetical protein